MGFMVLKLSWSSMVSWIHRFLAFIGLVVSWTGILGFMGFVVSWVSWFHKICGFMGLVVLHGFRRFKGFLVSWVSHTGQFE